MWIKKKKWDIEKQTYLDKEKITNLMYKDLLYVGNEGGIVKVYSDDLLYSFKAYDVRFDYLESIDILERVTAIETFDTGGVTQKLIVANERNIKVIEVRNSESTKNIIDGYLSKSYNFKTVKEFNDIHNYTTNSLSMSIDEQLFLSSDYLIVNLWCTEKLDIGCNTLLDIRPKKTDELVFVINATKFSPFDCDLFGYSTTSGDVIINDVRISSQSKAVNMVTCRNMNLSDGSLRSISDFNFIDSNTICVRNLNSILMFDLRKTKSELFKIDICETMFKSRDVFNTETVYDKFKLCNNDKHVFTGDFEGKMYAIDIKSGDFDVIVPNYNCKDKIKLAACKNGAFFCAQGSSVYKFTFEDGS